MAGVKSERPLENQEESQNQRISWDYLNYHLQRLGTFHDSFQDTWRTARSVASEALLKVCSPAKVLNNLAPSDAVVTHKGITYGQAPRQKLDVYVPRDIGHAPVPVLVFFHGGSWMTGERSIYRFLGAALAASGIMAVIPDYRLYPDVTFPGFMFDAADALAWTRANAPDFGADTANIFVMGHSAGAQIATLLSLDATYLKSKKLTPDILSGVIGLAGPYDFLPLTDPVYMNIFGPEEGWPASQPINYVTNRAPPMFLATGKTDDLVDPGNSHRLAARLQSAGNEAVVKVYPHAGHMTIVGAFAAQLSLFAPVRGDVLDFIAAHTVAKHDVIAAIYRRKMIGRRASQPGLSNAPA